MKRLGHGVGDAMNYKTRRRKKLISVGRKHDFVYGCSSSGPIFPFYAISGNQKKWRLNNLPISFSFVKIIL